MVGLSKNATLVARNIFPINFLNGQKKCPVHTDPVLKSHLFKAVQYFDAIDLNAEILNNSKLP